MRSMRNGPAIVALCALAACSAAPSWTPPGAADLEHAGPPAERVVEASFVDVAKAMFAPLTAPFASPPRIPGAIRRETGDTPCDYEPMLWEGPDGRTVTTEYPRPWVNYVDREPMVGREVAADFLTAVDSAPPWPMFLLMEVRDTFDVMHYPADALGMPGCEVQVDLARCKPVWPGGDPGNWAFGDGARIRVRFVPTADLVGKTVVIQSVVLPPKDIVRSGVVLGPALLVAVGEAR